jgi:opacity protein-like surface antigen
MRKAASTLATAVLAAGIAGPASAQDASEQRLEELERKVDILSQEIEGKRREGLVSKDYDYEPAYGVGGAGAKVYAIDQGLSIGGYGHGFYKNSSLDGQDETDFYRQIFYFGYRFNDWILLNTEIEIEHVEEIYVEFAYLDFLLHDSANVRAGMMLSPLGLVNEIHEPTTYFGNIRPEVEKRIIPTTSRENGVGLYGNLTDSLEYRLYVQNSFNAIDGNGQSTIGAGDIRGVRQKGAEAEADDLAVTGRLDWKPLSGVILGGSFWTGDMGHEQEMFDANTGNSLGTPAVHMDLYEAHAQYKRHGLWLRGMFAQAQIDDTQELSDSLGSGVSDTMTGWYAEIGYDIMPHIADRPEQSLYPWVRYTDLDTNSEVPSGYSEDPAQDRTITEAGLHYMPHPNVVVKGEVKMFDSEASSDNPGDNNQTEYLVGIGYNF